MQPRGSRYLPCEVVSAGLRRVRPVVCRPPAALPGSAPQPEAGLRSAVMAEAATVAPPRRTITAPLTLLCTSVTRP